MQCDLHTKIILFKGQHVRLITRFISILFLETKLKLLS